MKDKIQDISHEFNGNKLSLSHVFHNPIDVVWLKLKNIPKWLAKLKSFTDYQPLNDKKPSEIGFKFYYIYRHKLEIYYEVVASEDTDFKKSISLTGEFTMDNVKYMFLTEYCLFKNTSDNTSFLNYHQTFTNGISIDKDLKKLWEKESKLIFKGNDRKPSKSKCTKLEQVESGVIKLDKYSIWNSITFRSNLQEISDGLFGEICCEDENITQYSLLNFKLRENSETLQCSFRVIEYENDETSSIWRLTLESQEGEEINIEELILEEDNQKRKKDSTEKKHILETGKGDSFYIPFQTITFEILQIKEQECFLTITHKFSKNIEKANLNELSQAKKKFIAFFQKLA